MPPNSPATVDKILEYTAVVANSLRDVAAATQIPFLGKVCALALGIIPMVQVWHCHRDFIFHCLIRNAGQQVPKEPLPPGCRGDSSSALCIDEPVHPLG
jgi:hypothetical protein